jgi:hypothetical protein
VHDRLKLGPQSVSEVVRHVIPQCLHVGWTALNVVLLPTLGGEGESLEVVVIQADLCRAGQTGGKKVVGKSRDAREDLIGTTSGKVDLSLRIHWRVKLGNLRVLQSRSLELRVNLGRFGLGSVDESPCILAVPDIAG